MNAMFWGSLFVTLVAGGAMGAMIKILHDQRQSRKQPIGQRISVFPFFQSDKYADLQAVVTVTNKESVTEYRQIFVADLSLQNRGNRDFDEFEFGVVVGNGLCFHVGWENPDQHHGLELLTEASPSMAKSELKFKLCPFNRQDLYSLRLYLTPTETLDPVLSVLTTPHPIRFVSFYETPKQSLLKEVIIAFIIFMSALMVGVLSYLGGRYLPNLLS